VKQSRIVCFSVCLLLGACSDSTSGPAVVPDTGPDVGGDVGQDPGGGGDTADDVDADGAGPDAGDADTDEPDTDEPDTGEPDTDEPDTDEPDAGCPDGQMRCDAECVDTSTVEHCGGCDPCAAVPGAVPGCQEGVCIFACEPEFADADGDADNGCECAVVEDAVDVCDGVDNDCDGTVDGASVVDACPRLLHAAPRECLGEDGCRYTCLGPYRDQNEDLETGAESDGCECLVEPEVCDGVDNDCDGLVDDEDDDFVGCAPLFFAREACTDGACVYECADPYVDMNGDLGMEGSDGCECAVRLEVCDGEDNDCDGLVDSEDPDMVHDCAQRSGVCSGSMQECSDGELLSCTVEQYTQHALDRDLLYQDGQETHCDEQDNDCDNRVDDACCGAAFFQPLGQPRGTEVRPVLAQGGDADRWLVAWQETDAEEIHEESPRQGRLRWVRTNFLGVPLERVTGEDGGFSPAVTWTGEGWTLVNSAGSSIRWRRIAPDGTVTHQATILANVDAVYDELEIVHLGNGRTLLAWTTHRAQLVFPACMGVRCVEMAIVEADGTAGEAVQLGDPNLSREHWYNGHPSVVPHAGGAAVVWAEDTVAPHKIAIRIVNAQFEPATATYLTLPARGEDYAAAHPALMAYRTGFAVLYEAYVGDFQQIMVQVLAADGASVGQPRALTVGAVVKSWPQVVAQSDGGTGLVYRAGEDVVYQRLTDALMPTGEPVTLLDGANPAWESIAIGPGTRSVSKLITAHTVADDPLVRTQQREFNELGQLLCIDDAP
jgi:hypothetical protein